MYIISNMNFKWSHIMKVLRSFVGFFGLIISFQNIRKIIFLLADIFYGFNDTIHCIEPLNRLSTWSMIVV